MAVEDIVSGYLDTENGRLWLRTEECERVGSNILSLRGENNSNKWFKTDSDCSDPTHHRRDSFVLCIKAEERRRFLAAASWHLTERERERRVSTKYGVRC